MSRGIFPITRYSELHVFNRGSNAMRNEKKKKKKKKRKKGKGKKKTIVTGD